MLVLRTALRPKWVALFALLVVIVATFWQLGLWQLHVAQDKGASTSLLDNPSRPPVPITSLLRPHQDFRGSDSGRRVVMEGTYAASQQVLVPDRRLDGTTGLWVVDALTATPATGTDTGTAAATSVAAEGGTPVLAVVRGFVTDAAAAPAPPRGPVVVTGSLAPGESPSTATGLPSGQLGALDLSVLVNRWPGALYNVFVFATAEQAGGAEVPLATGLRRIPPPDPTGGGGLQWRNAAYALQWWVFAVFAVWMWFKMVRDDWLTGEAARSALTDDMDNGPRE